MPNIRDASLKKPEENPVLGGGQSGVVSPYAPQSNAKSVGSGQFTNLADYVSANQGGTQQLGQAIKSDVQKKATTAGENFQNTVRGSIQPNVESFKSARKNFESFFNKPNVTSEDISTATNLRTGQTPFYSQYYNALNDVNNATSQYSGVRNELQNLGSGQTLTNYLRGFGEEPSAKTLGETGLTRFLINQSQPGQEALNYATDVSRQMNLQPNVELSNLTNAYQQVTPEALQGFSDEQRQNYISSLGTLDRQRAGRNIAQSLGIQDVGQEQKNYQDLSSRYGNLNSQIQSEQEILNNINSLSEEQLYNILNQEISSSKINPSRIPVSRHPGFYYENFDFNTAVPVGQMSNVRMINPRESFWGGASENLSSKNYNTLNLQNRLQNKLPSLQQQQQDLQNQLNANKFLNYQNQLSNANTIQSTLNQNELAKLQALSQLSGYDYTDFLNRSIT